MDTDIKSLLLRIKENIRMIEGGDTSEPLLDSVRSDFLDLIELIKLFLISERDSYYGYFMMNMQFRVNFHSNSIAGIKLNEFPPVFEANPLLLCKFKLKEIIYIVCHEIDHVVLNHPAEMVKANPGGDQEMFYEFNLAADAAVNDRINHEIVSEKHGFMSVPDGLITSSVLKKMFHLYSVRPLENYAYYFNLIRGQGNPQSDSGAGIPMNGGESMMQKQNQKDGNGSPDDDGKEQNKQLRNANGDSDVQADDASDGSVKKEDSDEPLGGDNSKDGDNPQDGDNSQDGNGSKLGEKSQDGKESQSGKGSQPGENSIKENQSETGGMPQNGNEPQNGNGASDAQGQIVTAANYGGTITDHNWEAGNDAEDASAAVREFVNASVGMMNEESRGLMPGYFMSEVEKINKPPVLSWQAILKKYVGTITANKRKTRMRLNRRQPERFDLSGSMDDKVLKIVVAIDTSGSVSDHMIGQILNEIFAILAKRKHDITIIECDAKVQRVYKARTPADVKKKMAGRGGTWFSPVIEYINNDKYFRDALLIYFTDGYGEAEIPRPRTYRNMWVVFNNAKNLSVKNPYGIVLTL